MEASIRITDRAVIQTGTSIGERTDCVIVKLTTQTEKDLMAVLAQPHGNVYLAVDGLISADPPVKEIPAVQNPVVATILAPSFVPGTLTNQQRDEAIKALMQR